jgi:hypothetical protein
VVKNVLDPVKSQDAKYRTLKLDNAKLQAKLFSIVYVKDLCKVIGFVEADGCLTIPPPESDDHKLLALQTLLQEMDRAQDELLEPPAAAATNKKPRVEEKLSEKQIARRQMVEKQKVESEKAKEERKRNLKMLQQDKLARETDPNWKSGVSAACSKSGSGIMTFRDRHGE